MSGPRTIPHHVMRLLQCLPKSQHWLGSSRPSEGRCDAADGRALIRSRSLPGSVSLVCSPGPLLRPPASVDHRAVVGQQKRHHQCGFEGNSTPCSPCYRGQISPDRLSWSINHQFRRHKFTPWHIIMTFSVTYLSTVGVAPVVPAPPQGVESSHATHGCRPRWDSIRRCGEHLGRGPGMALRRWNQDLLFPGASPRLGKNSD